MLQSVHVCLTQHALCLQEYIHNENARLEEEQQFWSKEIVVRIEYKFCPNLTIIDTPGTCAGQHDACSSRIKHAGCMKPRFTLAEVLHLCSISLLASFAHPQPTTGALTGILVPRLCSSCRPHLCSSW